MELLMVEVNNVLLDGPWVAKLVAQTGLVDFSGWGGCHICKWLSGCEINCRSKCGLG